MSRIILSNATVFDGFGGEPRRADVVLEDEKILLIQRHFSGAGEHIDCTGLAVAPGFIDIHTHVDFTLPVKPHARSMVRQGVTTMLAGNCGFSPFPWTPTSKENLKASAGFLDAGIAWDRTASPSAFFDYVDEQPLAANVAFLVGHGALRMAAMGVRAGPPAQSEFDTMDQLLREALDQGAFGLSTGLTYTPGRFAATEELTALARTVGRHDGLYSSHIRSEGYAVVEAVEEALAVGGSSGVRLQLSHHKIMGRRNWGKISSTLGSIESAARAGVDVGLDQYPYTAGSTSLTVALPPWVLEGGRSAMRRRLADPSVRNDIRDQIALQDPADLAAGLREFEPRDITIAHLPSTDNSYADLSGRSIHEGAEARGMEPVDLVLDLVAAFDDGVLTIMHGQLEENLEEVLRFPLTCVASDGWTLDEFSGGLPHPRNFGCFPRVLGRYVREHQVLTVSEAIRRMTSLPADRIGLPDRGRLEPGRIADVVVFDPETVSDRATFESPKEYPVGIEHVFVNGVAVVSHGQATRAAPGSVLLKR